MCPGQSLNTQLVSPTHTYIVNSVIIYTSIFLQVAQYIEFMRVCTVLCCVIPCCTSKIKLEHSLHCFCYVFFLNKMRYKIWYDPMAYYLWYLFQEQVAGLAIYERRLHNLRIPRASLFVSCVHPSNWDT